MFVRHARLNVSRSARCHLSTITPTKARIESIEELSTQKPSTKPHPIKLSRQDVEKFYTLFKMSEFSPSMTHEDKLSKSLRLWLRKSRKEHNSIHAALEMIVNEAVELGNGTTKSNFTKNVPSFDATQEMDRDDEVEAYKKPKYRYNMTSGTRLLKFKTPLTKIRSYYQYLQLQAYKDLNRDQQLDAVTKSKVLTRAHREWRQVSSFERFILKTNYENLLHKGMDVSENNEEIVPVEVSEGYDGVVHKVLGEADPGSNRRENKRIPFLKLILNEMTGMTHVYGLSDFHVWNYFLGKQYTSRVKGDEGGENIGKVIEEIENEWVEMNTEQKNTIQTEYMNMLSRGQDLLYGKLVNVEVKRDVVDKPKQYQVLRVRGDSSLFKVDACDASPSKFTITQPGKLRFIKNTFVGNTIVIGEVDLVHAWNYFVYKQRQEGAIDNELQFRHDLMHKWNNEMDDEEKQQYLQEYKAMLVSGYDIYMGEKVTIESKMAQTGIKNLIVDVWGQPITQGTGRNVKVSPLPISIDKIHNKVLVLSDITNVHAYNYYLAKQLEKQGNKGNPDYSILGQFLQEWLEFTPKQREEYADEYLKLINSGKDYAFGKVIPIADKLKFSIYSNPVKLVGQGTKSAFHAEKKKDVITDSNFDEVYPNAFPYYVYSRKAIDNATIDNEAFIDEWRQLSRQEKFEVQEAYKMMVDAGFEMVNGVLKDVLSGREDE